jgi:hypothetical protein
MAGSISATTGLLIAGGVSSVGAGLSKVMAGEQQKKAYDYDAAITTENTANQVVAEQQKFSALVGRQASAYAASGVDVASGSPLLILAATAARSAQEEEQTEQSGTEQANLQRYYGKMAAFSGIMGGIGSFLNGMTATLTQYGKLTNNPTPSGWGDQAPYGPDSD